MIDLIFPLAWLKDFVLWLKLCTWFGFVFWLFMSRCFHVVESQLAWIEILMKFMLLYCIQWLHGLLDTNQLLAMITVLKSITVLKAESQNGFCCDFSLCFRSTLEVSGLHEFLHVNSWIRSTWIKFCLLWWFGLANLIFIMLIQFVNN